MLLKKTEMMIVVLAVVGLQACSRHDTGGAVGVADRNEREPAKVTDAGTGSEPTEAVASAPAARDDLPEPDGPFVPEAAAPARGRVGSPAPPEPGPAGGAGLDLGRGLIGHWTFDEGEGTIARDSSGGDNHGEIVGGAKWAKGRIGGALEFDGTDDFVSIPDEGSFDVAGSITVAAWIKVNSFTRSWQAIVTKGDRAWRLHRASDSSSLGWACSDLSRQDVGDHYGKTAVDDGRWHHVAGVYNGTTASIFVDGEVDVSERAVHTISVNDYRVLIGENAQRTGRHFRGIIDDVRIYDRALSADEIRLLAHPEEWAKAEPAPPSATTALDALLTKFDSLMAKGEHAAARAHAEAEAAKPANAAHADALRAAARVAKALADRPAAVRRGAESLVGKEARLRLKKGTTPGKIKEVTDDHLVVATTFMINRQPRERLQELAWSALHPEQEDEFAEKGGWKVEAVERAVARAYAALASGDLDAAESAVREAGGHPLAEHLKARVAKVRVEAEYTAAMDRARARMRLRDWKGAVESLEEALAAKPDDAEANKLLGKAECEGRPPTLTLDLGGGVTMELVYIKPGVFVMGGNEDSKYGWQGVEKPKHEVAITRGFYMGKYEVTQAQYEAVVGRNPSKWKEPTRPVEQVTWHEATEFCRLAAERTRKQFRLPTEAEWEFACRAGSTGRHCFGSDETGLGGYAWFKNNSGEPTHPVGQKKPNRWGLYDVHGNVWEWVADWYAANYYANSPRENPQGPDSGRDRPMRGGGCHDLSCDCRSAIRNRQTPSNRSRIGGFRAVVSSSPRVSADAHAAYARAMSRAKMRVRVRDWKGVAEACEEALKHKPGDPEAKKLLAEAESHIGPTPTLTLDLGGGVTMEFVYIKPGVFMMGGTENIDPKYEWQGVEKPKHEVAITRGFYIGKYEVTQTQYEAVVGKNPSKWKEPTRPVEQVTWYEAAEFCRLATERTRRQFRLPTEAEWEYACRAGSMGRYCFGSDETRLGDYAWCKSNSGGQTHPVGQKKLNAWGLYDMHGNVWEWVADWYAANYYAKTPRENPTGPNKGDRRLLRGNSWYYPGLQCRSAIRGHDAPSGRRNGAHGFRAAVSAVPLRTVRSFGLLVRPSRESHRCLFPGRVAGVPAGPGVPRTTPR